MAIQRILELFEREPKIDNWNFDKGLKPSNNDDESFEPDIKFNEINFSYPNRSSVQVINNFSLSIKKGQKIALVGSSGCGKSTITQLLERFYDPSSGSIQIGNYYLKDLNLEWLRSKISIVSQEPILLDATIAENIAYGDNSREIDINEIIQVAQLANIHDFIASLPLV